MFLSWKGNSSGTMLSSSHIPAPLSSVQDGCLHSDQQKQLRSDITSISKNHNAQYWSFHFRGSKHGGSHTLHSCMQLHHRTVSEAWECIRSHLLSFTTDRCANTANDAKGLLPYILISIYYCLTGAHTFSAQVSGDRQQSSPVSPTPQRLPITKVVINSTVFPSREKDFNDARCLCTWQPLEHRQGSSQPASQLSAPPLQSK